MPSPNQQNGNGHNGSGALRGRPEWISRRKAANRDGNFSQMHYARLGVTTEEMGFVAFRTAR